MTTTEALLDGNEAWEHLLGRLDVARVAAVAVRLDALLDAYDQRLEHILDIHQRFTPIVRTGGGAPEIAATLHLLLECPIAVLDPDGRPTVVVPPDAGAGTDFTTANWGWALTRPRAVLLASIVPETAAPTERRRIAERLRRKLGECRNAQ